MGHQICWELFFKFTWMLVFYFPSVCSGQDEPYMRLDNTVFVALSGEDIVIKGYLRIHGNQSEDNVTCLDASDRELYSRFIPTLDNLPVRLNISLKTNNLKKSGEYSCQYKTAKAYWYLLLRAEGYRNSIMWNPTELVMAIFICVLLLFSVVGSVYVFRGNWKEHITQCGDFCWRKKQKREDRKSRGTREHSVDATATTSSFYASLETRPRSIYDVLEPSAASSEPDQNKSKGKKKEHKKTNEESTQQAEGVSESVYENF